MSVVVQRMINPSVAGTAFSQELSTGFPAVHISATYGIGEAVVSGEVTADEWLVEKVRARGVIKRVLGSKRTEFRQKRFRSSGSLDARSDAGGLEEKTQEEQPSISLSGIEQVDVSEERRTRFCLDSVQAQALGSIIEQIEAVYKLLFGYSAVDTEFALDEAGRLFMLQSRPVVESQRDEIKTINIKGLQKDSVICTGAYSLLGAVSGRAKVIVDFAELVSGRVAIGPDDIVVTAKTANYWNQYLTNLRGIVTMEGSATAHPMLIGRERHLPVIRGVPGLIERMKRFDGSIVTMDGLTKKIYLGKQELRVATIEEISTLFDPPKVPKLQDFDAGLEFLAAWKRAVRDLEDDGVWWEYNPMYKLSAAWIEMASYPMLIGLISACRARAEPLPENALDIATRAIDGLCADRCTRETVNTKQTIYDEFSLEDAELFHETILAEVKRYTNACEEFAARKTPETWRAYAEAHSAWMAVMTLHYYWQLWLKRKSAEAARELGMSKMHFEQLLVRVQEDTPEEDVRYRMKIIQAAVLIEESHSVASSEADEDMDQSRLLDTVPGLLDAVTYMARTFRTKQVSDVPGCLDDAIKLVFEKVIEAFKAGDTNVATLSHASGATTESVKVEFFPDDTNANLMRWTRLSVMSRCQKSDFHHFRLAGQWKVRDALEQIFKAAGHMDDSNNGFTRMLTTASTAEIESHVRRFNEALQERALADVPRPWQAPRELARESRGCPAAQSWRRRSGFPPRGAQDAVVRRSPPLLRQRVRGPHTAHPQLEFLLRGAEG